MTRFLLIPVVCLAFVIGVGAHASAASKPSWKCVSGVCLGMSREATEHRFGAGDPRNLYFSVNVPGGRLWLSFFKEVDRVALDDATRLNYVSQIQTCDRLFRLPDGVVQGTRIPVGKTWRGYKLVANGSEFHPTAPVWEKRLQVGAKKIRVRLHVEKSRVKCLGLSRVFGVRR